MKQAFAAITGTVSHLLGVSWCVLLAWAVRPWKYSDFDVRLSAIIMVSTIAFIAFGVWQAGTGKTFHAILWIIWSGAAFLIQFFGMAIWAATRWGYSLGLVLRFTFHKSMITYAYYVFCTLVYAIVLSAALQKRRRRNIMSKPGFPIATVGKVLDSSRPHDDGA
jgi:hypothetical protein